MKTAVIYARYSSSNQTEQSIEGQLRVCHEFAERENILILDTYIDRAMTGTNDNRADFQRMIKDSSVLSEYPIILAILLMSIASGYIANLFSSIFANLFLSFRLRNANTLIPSPEASSVSGDSLLREENCPRVNSFLLSVMLLFIYALKSSSLT